MALFDPPTGLKRPHTDFRFYFGAANGTAQKVLRQLEEPNVMISYATKNNRPWPGIESLFIDSGGYTLMTQGGDHGPAEDYLDYVARVQADLFAIQDFPCEPESLEAQGRSVREHQGMTTEAAAHILARVEERHLNPQPVVVVQGWEPSDYRRHAEELMRQGVTTPIMGIGSICRRGQTQKVRKIIKTVADVLPNTIDLHAFGIKGDVLQFEDVREQLYSADSTAYDFQLDQGVLNRFQATAREYLEFKTKIRRLRGQQSMQEIRDEWDEPDNSLGRFTGE